MLESWERGPGDEATFSMINGIPFSHQFADIQAPEWDAY